MAAFILASALTDRSAVESLVSLPDFRRATVNMRMAYQVAKEVMQSIPAETPRERIALVVGTSYGELPSTYDFFAGLASEQIARPLAFQNSLHHSTLGFVSRMLKITGPGFTVSREYFTGEDALELGAQMLTAAGAEFAIVVGVDGIVDSVKALMQERIGERYQLGEGAGAVLLSAEKRGARFALAIDSCPRSLRAVTPEHSQYDSDAIALLAQALQRPGFSGGEIALNKPNGRQSKLILAPSPVESHG